MVGTAVSVTGGAMVPVGFGVADGTNVAVTTCVGCGKGGVSVAFGFGGGGGCVGGTAVAVKVTVTVISNDEVIVADGKITIGTVAVGKSVWVGPAVGVEPGVFVAVTVAVDVKVGGITGSSSVTKITVNVKPTSRCKRIPIRSCKANTVS